MLPGGRQPAQQIIEQFTATRIEVTDPAIAIKINRTFAYGMDAETLYESTRGVWVIARSRAPQARCALAALHGVVKEVYEIESWQPAGETPYCSRVFEPGDFQGRAEFASKIAADSIREKYLGKRVIEDKNQNPIRYFRC